MYPARAALPPTLQIARSGCAAGLMGSALCLAIAMHAPPPNLGLVALLGFAAGAALALLAALTGNLIPATLALMVSTALTIQGVHSPPLIGLLNAAAVVLGAAELFDVYFTPSDHARPSDPRGRSDPRRAS